MEEDSLYQKTNSSPYWSFMHNGISKFTTDFIAVFSRGINEVNNPINAPFNFTKVSEALNVFGLVNELFKQSGKLQTVTIVHS